MKLVTFSVIAEMHDSATSNHFQHILDRIEDVIARHPVTDGIHDQNYEVDGD